MKKDCMILIQDMNLLTSTCRAWLIAMRNSRSMALIFSRVTPQIEAHDLFVYVLSSINLLASMRATTETMYWLPWWAWEAARTLGALTGPMSASCLPAAPTMSGRLRSQM